MLPHELLIAEEGAWTQGLAGRLIQIPLEILRGRLTFAWNGEPVLLGLEQLGQLRLDIAPRCSVNHAPFAGRLGDRPDPATILPLVERTFAVTPPPAIFAEPPGQFCCQQLPSTRNICCQKWLQIAVKQIFYAQIMAGDEPDVSSKLVSREGDSNPHALAGSGF